MNTPCRLSSKHRPNPPLVAFSILMMLAVILPCAAAPEPLIQIEPVAGGFRASLAGGGASDPWVIQHSTDARVWRNLKFFEAEDGEAPSVEVPLELLPQPDAPRGFFRAVRLAEDSALLRRFLAERAKWRLGAVAGYTYELRQNMGSISWRGSINVSGGEIASFQTIDLQPPFVEVPEIPTIEDLFDRIEQAIGSGAATIDVSWDAKSGVPLSAFIDFDPLLADEEQGWNVESITFNP